MGARQQFRERSEGCAGVYRKLRRNSNGLNAGRQDYSVIPDVAGGGTQVDDGRSRGAAVRKGVHVGHHVVPQLALLLGRHGEVDVLLVALHLLNLGLCDGQTQGLKDRRQKDTEASPYASLVM